MGDSLRTLSTHGTDGSDSSDSNIEGFLYVPDLSPSDPCFNTSSQYIPESATRLSDLQNLEQYNVIALAPWISKECIYSYFAAAGMGPTKAFITYEPNNSTDTPPAVSDGQWGLEDGGRWKANNDFPVYAVPGASGSAVMQQLPQYSGNISMVKNHDQLPGIGAAPTDMIRVYCNIQTNTKATLPSLWAFLLIVLGVVLFLVGCTSLAMHWYQRHTRSRLRRRITNGEIDLESLGIRRLTVPHEVVQKLPTHIYTASKEPPIPEAPEYYQSGSGNSPAPDQPGQADAIRRESLHQPACAICLEDFVHLSTTVRELPCRHIYHPECIDLLLLRHSSLCPVCKAKVLPKGYCPQVITNLMVRRERQLRNSRNRVAPTSTAHGPGAPPGAPGGRSLAVQGRAASLHRTFGRANLPLWGRRASSAPTPSSSTELTERGPPVPAVNTIGTTSAAPESPAPATGDRSERARRRVSTILGHQPMLEDEERERIQRLPRCKFPSHASLDNILIPHLQGAER